MYMQAPFDPCLVNRPRKGALASLFYFSPELFLPLFLLAFKCQIIYPRFPLYPWRSAVMFALTIVLLPHFFSAHAPTSIISLFLSLMTLSFTKTITAQARSYVLISLSF